MKDDEVTAALDRARLADTPANRELLARLRPGGIILDAPLVPNAVWGKGDEVLWAKGQGCLLFGNDGTGKTQLAANLTRALAAGGDVLGYPVRDDGEQDPFAADGQGIKGTPLSTPYTASKHGVVGMSLALANELAGQNIRVNTVHPTGVATGMMPGLHPLLANERPDLAPVYANALPVQLVDARDVSNAVLFLVSDESRYVTGLEFKVDAGLTIR